MGRRILMTGKDAKYVHIHSKDASQSERDILLTGENAECVEVTIGDKTYEKATDK
jgi:hypothetical protein